MSGVQKVREIQANSRVRDGSQPYAYPPAAAGAAGTAAPAAAGGPSAQQQPNGMANNGKINLFKNWHNTEHTTNLCGKHNKTCQAIDIIN
jgi:hypothetical protein